MESPVRCKAHAGFGGEPAETYRWQHRQGAAGLPEHHRHGANLQVLSAPDGFPLWIGEARPGRGHDSTAAHHTGVQDAIALLNIGVPAEKHLLVLVDLGYEKFRDFPAVRTPHKKPKNGELTEIQRAYNRLHGALRALAEKANADLKVRFACLDKVSLNPWGIGTIARACLAFFRIERPRRPKNITQSA